MAELAPANKAMAAADQTGVAVGSSGGQAVVPQFTRAQLLALADDTEVLGKKLGVRLAPITWAWIHHFVKSANQGC